MPIEIAQLRARADNAAEFLQAFEQGSAAYYAQAGCLANRMLVSDDDPTSVVAIVDWASMDAQRAAAASETGQRFLASIGPLLREAPTTNFFVERPAPASSKGQVS